ncbi:MAG: adenylate/guanylate cyclase domain-containing protein, partial [Spirochaetota bacterium]
DGSIRAIRLIRVFDGRIHFHMALTLLSDICGIKKENIEIRPGRYIALRGALNPVTMKRGDIVIPVDARCAMNINWAGSFERSFRHLPFYALLEYDMVKDDIHAWLDDTEIQSGSTERSVLYGQKQQYYDEAENEKDDARRRERYFRYKDTLKKIAAIEDSYVKSIQEQRDAAAKEYDADSSPAGKRRLADIDNMLTAVRIVRDVDSLKDCVCVTGYTANASYDFAATPVESRFFMVGTYPNIINTVLQKAFVHRTPKAAEVFIMFIFALGIAWIVLRQNAKMSIIISVLALFSYNALNIALFSFADLWLDQLGVSLALVFPSAAIIGVKFLSEESQKRFIRETFSKYLAKQVVDELIKDPEMVKLGGEEQSITIFFSDIQSFTSFSEKMTPTMLVDFLNEYLSDMTDIILSNRGTVDKFIGDAVMAFYGAPFHYDDHALAACNAAVDMQARLADMRKVWKKQGHASIYARCGINTGTAVVGNMGSRDRLSYTAMGDSVNLASRLEGVNKYYGTYSMISESTYAEVKDYMDVRYLDKIRVVGKVKPVSIYELICRKGDLSKDQKELIEIYGKGISLFADREWVKAKKMFSLALKAEKDDGPSKTYIGRCSEFILNPPPKKWDGVYVMKSK